MGTSCNFKYGDPPPGPPGGSISPLGTRTPRPIDLKVVEMESTNSLIKPLEMMVNGSTPTSTP